MTASRAPLAAVAASALILSAAPQALASSEPPSASAVVTQTLYPVIDTDARGVSTTATHWLHELVVANTGSQDSSGSSSAYLRFDVSTLPGEIIDASLELNALEPPVSPLVLRTEYVADDSWQPTRERAEQPQYEMTGATKAASTPISGTAQTFHTGTYRAKVGDQARQTQAGDGLLSLRVLAPEPEPAARAVFGADENAHDTSRPRLTVTMRLAGQALIDHQRAWAALKAARGQVRPAAPVTEDLPFAERGVGGAELDWSSWGTDFLTDDGGVSRPSASLGDRDVPVDLTVTNGQTTLEERLLFTVDALETDAPRPVSAAVEVVEREPRVDELIATRWSGDFEHVTYPAQNLGRERTVAPGESIQAAIDQLAADGSGGVVRLAPGIHTVGTTINLKHRITLVGAGAELTEIRFTGTRAAISTTTPTLTDVVVKDLTLSGTRGDAVPAHGILVEGRDPVSARHNRLAFQNLIVRDFGVHGVHIKRASNIILTNSRVHHNGEANGLYHNVYWLFDNNIFQSGDDMSDPIRGKGAKYTSTAHVIVQNSRITDSSVNGIQADGANDTKLLFHNFDITDSGKTALWFICEIFSNPNLYTEDPQYAPRHVIISDSQITGNRRGGVWKIASDVYVVNSVFDNIESDLMLLKSRPEFENTSFRHTPTYTEDPSAVPQF
jgi:hypothetical protein